MRVKLNDTVRILRGASRGKEAKVIKILASKGKIVVEGVNLVWKHMKPNRRNAQGGRLSMEMPIAVSTVKVVCPQCAKATRIGFRYLEDGTKERWCKKCEQSISVVAPPKSRYAKK
ncbi:MAG: 50S ribosomal protein L24 [Planctomycetales bacterium]